jgi:hypothetical protein
MAKNVMLNAISKADFNRKVVEATNAFRTLYNNGMPISVAGKSGGKCTAVKAAIQAVIDADPSMTQASRDTIALLLKSTGDGGSVAKTSRAATAEELDKQRLTFVPYAAVTILRNRSHHAYKIGETYVMVHGDAGADHDMFGMDTKGCIISKSANAIDGLSHLPRYRRSIRPATNTEIFNFVDRLYR